VQFLAAQNVLMVGCVTNTFYNNPGDSMPQLNTSVDNATDAQLEELCQYHKEQWLRFAKIIRLRMERKRFKAIMACDYCTTHGEFCKEHKP